MTGEEFGWGLIAAAAWAIKLFPYVLLVAVATVAYWYGKRRK